ncbi:MAG: 3-isopropylmalate dehydratase [Rickettsiales bacterium]|nr:3-isopropylmalate dehydratase [Rickettsiales bacterium]
MSSSETVDSVEFPGRVLFLTEDSELIQAQFGGENLPFEADRALVNNISTDEITPGWTCFYYDETLGHYSLVGLRGGTVSPGDLASGGFSVVVSGESKGCGSSRETAPYSELYAGVRLVVARSIEKIYGQNAQNIGLLTSTDFGLIPRILAGEKIPMEEFLVGLDPISRGIVLKGGLFNYNRARLAGEVAPPPLETPVRAMNIVEKIIARHTVVDAATGRLGVPAVAPGDAVFVRADIRFSHDYTSAMCASLFKDALGADARISEPESVFAFRDHLTFLGDVMPEKHRSLGLLDKADNLAEVQRAFAHEQGIRLYDEMQSAEGTKGSEAICHNAVLDDLALPGQIVCGTDSHTCTAGALGCFAFGVGATDMANAWYTRDVRVKVPRTVRFNLLGAPASGITAKDIILYLMAQPYIKGGKAIAQVLEFAGEGLAHLSFDERAVLTNMAVEAGATTGIVEPDAQVLDHLMKMRSGLDRVALEALCYKSDPGASYAAEFDVRLDKIVPMVATPGDPRNGVPLTDLGERVEVDIAYGGSCTGGKRGDMDQYASVLGPALERGERVAAGVDAYIQFGSQKIKDYARERGYIDIFEQVGIQLIDPSCGACINAGPGTSRTTEHVTVSAINRNFPGRSGPGKVYLASPLVVAASALTGYISGPRLG